MHPKVSYAIIGFAWRGDVARPVELTVVYDREVADDIVAEPMEGLSAIAVYAMPLVSTEVAVLVRSQGAIPAAWLAPRVADIVTIRLDD